MAKALAKFWATSTRERDVDTNHRSLIAPSRGATPTEPMNQTRRQAKMIGRHVVFNNPLLVRKSSFSLAHACPFKTIRGSFLIAGIARQETRPILPKIRLILPNIDLIS